jgi:hypothetical protein
MTMSWDDREPAPTVRQQAMAAAGGVMALLTVAACAGLAGYLLTLIWHPLCGRDPVLESDPDREIAALCMAVSPGENGAWWLDQKPWLIPAARKRLAAGVPHDEPTEGSAPEVNLPSEMADIAKRLKEIVRLEAVESVGVGEYYLAILKDLPENSCHSGAEHHLRALLSHKAAVHQPRPVGTDPEVMKLFHRRWEAVERQYDLALNAYEWSEVGLAALCWADRGRMFADSGRHLDSARAYRKARTHLEHYVTERKLANSESPPPPALMPFLAHCYCAEAAAYRTLGQLATAEFVLNTALSELLGMDEIILAWRTESANPAELTSSENQTLLAEWKGRELPAPTAAYVLERSGWLGMDRWQVSRARRCFELAHALRGSPASEEEDDGLAFEDQLRNFHNLHGIAMAERYAGNAGEAARRYQDLRDRLRRMRANDPTFAADTPTEYQRRLAQFQSRYLNTMERLADCELYGRRDGELAYAKLAETLEQFKDHDLLARRTNETPSRLCYKQSLALLLQGADAPTNREELFQQARQTWAVGQESDPGENSPRLAFLQQVSRACLDLFHFHADRAESPELAAESGASGEESEVPVAPALENTSEAAAPPAQTLHDTLRSEYLKLRTQNLVSRDELDVSLLAVDFLLRKPGSEAVSHARLAVELARLPARENALIVGEDDFNEVLGYLRPTYQRAIQVLLDTADQLSDEPTAQRRLLITAADYVIESLGGQRGREIDRPAAIFVIEPQRTHAIVFSDDDFGHVGYERLSTGSREDQPTLHQSLATLIKQRQVEKSWTIVWAQESLQPNKAWNAFVDAGLRFQFWDPKETRR